jgi:hypothetical protein
MAFSSRTETRFGLEERRRLQRGQGHELHHVVLEHVPQHPGLVVVAGAVSTPRDSGAQHAHRAHVVAVPDRLEDRVGEAEQEHVLEGLLGQVVVDAEDLVLGHQRCRAASSSRAVCKSRPKGFSTTTRHHPSGPGEHSRPRQVVDHAS